MMKRKLRGTVGMVVVFVMAFGVAQSAYGSPIFSIGENRGGWEDALNNNIRPVLASEGGVLTGAAENFYSTQGMPFQLVDAVLTAEDTNNDPILAPDTEGTLHESLVMQLDLPNPTEDTLAIAAWEYVYDVDPDLSNAMIHFSLNAPPGVWDVSIELISDDGLGNLDSIGSRGWFLSMPPNIWTDYWITANQIGPQGVFGFSETTNFDITKVVAIRLDEAGGVGPSFPPFGTPPPVPGLPLWNAWNHLEVTVPVPEPVTALLGGLGLMALSAATWRRRV